MQFNFENLKDLEQINTYNVIYFVTEEYVENYLKEKGKCVCGLNCSCGEECKCEKSPLQQVVYEYNFKAKENEISVACMKSNNLSKVIFVGLGKEEELTSVKLEEIGYKAFKYARSNKIKTATILVNLKLNHNNIFDYPEVLNMQPINTIVSRLIFGFSMGEYNFTKYLSEEKAKAKSFTPNSITVATKHPEELEKLFNELNIVKDNVFFCRDLVNEPANVIYPESVVKMAKEELDKLGVEIEVLKEKDMEKLGMGSLLAVGQGSDNESYMLILKWNGAADKKEQPLAFVGKGVTFDSGGLSLKPSNAMDTMKCDMSGSAVVFSLIRLLAMRKAKVNAVAVMPLVENMPSGKSIKVGDVVKSMSGQTIEIMNTDAEGRMILADALYYTATKLDPKIIIDLATLTGAICVALGEKYAGLFTNNNELSKELENAGNETGETVWRMPLSKLGGFYDKQIDSEIADVRNLGKTRDGGSITAGQFLQRFINNHTKWAHIDIAATAFVNQEIYLTQKFATGYGVRLLNELIIKNYEK